MFLFIIIAFLFLCYVFVPFRLVAFHPVSSFRYLFQDLYNYLSKKDYNICATGELVAYVGLFGKGKTLSAVNKVCTLYRKYNDKEIWDRDRKKFVTQKIIIISNVHLTQVPYIELTSLQQIVEAAEINRIIDDENDTRTVTLILGDEFSVQMNSRNFKSNIDPLFLNTILTCRHHHISLYYTAQRFSHVDALLRQVTSFVVSCDKLWRFQRKFVFDAWELEKATCTDSIKPLSRSGFFIRNMDYSAYDTLACVGNLSKEVESNNMLSAAEILELQGNSQADSQSIINPSRKFKKSHK